MDTQPSKAPVDTTADDAISQPLSQPAFGASAKDLLSLELRSSLEKFTRAMFRQQYKRSFLMSYHHKLICKALQDVVDGKCKRLMINMPPRYSKTELCIKSFASWGYALNPKCKFLHLSYSDTLVNDNSDTVRSIMMEPLYKELFPESALEKERGSSKRWKTKAGGEFYAVSTQGQVTGFGAGLVDEDPDAALGDTSITGIAEIDDVLNMFDAKSNIFNGAILIDDPMKPEDAESDVVRERINMRFENTIRNRTNSRNTPIIIIMQRVHEHDLCGYLQELEPDEWRVLSLSAIQKVPTDENIPIDEDKPETYNEMALWPVKHSLEELYSLRDKNPIVFDTQYMQDPKPREGLMYSEGFHTYTYEQLPKTSQPNMPIRRLAYIDTADTGADSLCAISFLDTPEFVYILDVLYTDAPMEVTEPKTAALLNNTGVQEALIESNNGGRSFARTIKMKLRTVFKNFRIVVRSFTQTQNKKTRIFTNSAQVQNDILMPEGWEKKWPKFHSAITSYRKDNRKKSQHDDAPDALTGVYEMHAKKLVSKKIKVKNR